MELSEAISELTRAGAVFAVPAASGSLSLSLAAQRLDVSPSWVRQHLEEFPGAWRLPAGSRGDRNVGELRIPVRDLEALEKRQALRKAVLV